MNHLLGGLKGQRGSYDTGRIDGSVGGFQKGARGKIATWRWMHFPYVASKHRRSCPFWRGLCVCNVKGVGDEFKM